MLVGCHSFTSSPLYFVCLCLCFVCLAGGFLYVRRFVFMEQIIHLEIGCMSGQENKDSKPKKIVINNIRKSLIGGGGLTKQFMQTDLISQSLSLNNNNLQSTGANLKQITKLTQQLTYYKEKHDQSLIKVRFLTDKLESYGGLNSIPETISNQISQTDAKIKNLEELLHFRRSKQMKKLKNRVLRFVQLMEFQVSEDDLNKIEDQIQIIFFLIDIFTQKYNQIITEKAEIDQIVDQLKTNTVFNFEKAQDQNKFLKQKVTEQTQYIRELEIEVFGLKKEIQSPTSALSRANIHMESLLRNPSIFSTSPKNQAFSGGIGVANSKLYEQTIQSLQAENQELIAKNNRLESTIKNNEYELITQKRRTDQCQNLLQKQRLKCRDLQQQLLKVQREQVRWKQRYELMERQKNERIELLERQKKGSELTNMSNISNVNSYTSFPQPHYQQMNVGLEKRALHVNIKRKSPASDTKYRIDDQIVEDSGQEYYDLATP